MERNARTEAAVRFREKPEPRFDDCFCGGFGGVAAAIWLEERKSENEDGDCGTGRVVRPTGTGCGFPAPGEIGGLSTRASAPRSSLISLRERTNDILLLDVLIWGKALPHGGVDCVHWGQAATELFSWFTLVHATLGITEVVPAGIRVVTGTCEAGRQAVSVLERESGYDNASERAAAYSVEVGPTARHDLVEG